MTRELQISHDPTEMESRALRMRCIEAAVKHGGGDVMGLAHDMLFWVMHGMGQEEYEKFHSSFSIPARLD